MMLVAEWHGLVANDADAGDVIGANEFRPGPTQPGNEKHRAEDAPFRDLVN